MHAKNEKLELDSGAKAKGKVPDERTCLKQAIDKYLKTLAPDVFYRKKWGGGVFMHEGDSDYTLCAWGRFGVIEAKHPITQPPLAPAQELYHRKVKAAGGFVIVAMSVDVVRHELARVYIHTSESALA